MKIVQFLAENPAIKRREFISQNFRADQTKHEKNHFLMGGFPAAKSPCSFGFYITFYNTQINIVLAKASQH